MLSEQEQQQITQLIQQSETTRAALPEALLIVQQRQGWVSDEQLRELADLMKMTPDEVDEIATFYNMIFRRPVGRHVILLCDSVSCWIMGVNPLQEHLHERFGITIGETTADGRFTLLPSVCLGACDHAPVMMVDNDLHGDLTPDRVDEILATYK
jgi:NADH-quinone oxidoreductase subunit E